MASNDDNAFAVGCLLITGYAMASITATLSAWAAFGPMAGIVVLLVALFVLVWCVGRLERDQESRF